MNRRFGEVLVGIGITCFLSLAYFIGALHLDLPASQWIRDLYGQPRGRVGPWPIYLLTIGGLFALGRGLVLMGIAEDDGFD